MLQRLWRAWLSICSLDLNSVAPFPFSNIIKKMYANVLPICFNVCLIVTGLMTFFNIYKIFINYRIHCNQVIRGDYSEIHVGSKSSTSLMTGNLKYQAYQTAYIGVGFIIQTYVFTFLTVSFTFLFILPLKIPIVFIQEWYIDKLSTVLPSLIYLLISIGLGSATIMILHYFKYGPDKWSLPHLKSHKICYADS